MGFILATPVAADRGRVFCSEAVVVACSTPSHPLFVFNVLSVFTLGVLGRGDLVFNHKGSIQANRSIFFTKLGQVYACSMFSNSLGCAFH